MAIKRNTATTPWSPMNEATRRAYLSVNGAVRLIVTTAFVAVTRFT